MSSIFRFSHHRFLSLILLSVYLTGCSTIHGRQNNEQLVLFEATPRTVNLVCSGKAIETPGSIALMQRHNHTCRARLDGYENKTFRIASHVSKAGFKASTDANAKTWGWWTLGLGILIGWTVDLVSGSMRNLERNDYHIVLQKSGTTTAGRMALDKTIDVTHSIISTPKEIIDNTAGVIMDTTVRESSEKFGAESLKETVHYPSPEGPQEV